MCHVGYQCAERVLAIAASQHGTYQSINISGELEPLRLFQDGFFYCPATILSLEDMFELVFRGE
jgi:hypothetical protein